MKVLGLVSFLVATVAGVSAQLSAPMKNYNVTSPVSNGPYVVGQVVPCTYQLFNEYDTSVLKLQISLESATNSSINFPITTNADISKTTEFSKFEGNYTYYEHSINYQIPSTVAVGQYNVVFLDATTQTKLVVPIEVRAAAVIPSTTIPPSKAATEGSSSPTGGSGASTPASSNIFAGNSGAMTSPGLATKTLFALAAVAGIAFML
ncbi:hypothetical protein J3Q64DRAFT_1726242 [Phycomyces blakesleeanus]|uniref:Uncharacterized protein n=2 Tax=Phycomyces blakesleeanus TaxID=4837 RepID=A0A167R5M7_PHYB8|nr:hypothetical protein PHYBLDRAFT_157006 [Phycomyces blakesleeanus NRRL 1555(-)]OAD80899.1 hypothetical protein PHYBLDRAFT_157006 [Phycomyces blakesleeanus NRRL 1555(-)]|eukprot:XP_018298939.1 hypothetical protein PHYBLDRAFT_157006 [Phycomyces blakesleeanus NRRL 1555(-)]